jgi:hypothetical protein
MHSHIRRILRRFYRKGATSYAKATAVKKAANLRRSTSYGGQEGRKGREGWFFVEEEDAVLWV